MKQITEDYVSFETAKLLSEKGFDELSTVFYNEDGTDLIELYDYEPLRNSEISGYARITQSLALKWLREVHNIYIDILTYTTGKNIQFRWVGYDKGRLFSQEEGKTIYFDSYEQAVEAALKYTLENLI